MTCNVFLDIEFSDSGNHLFPIAIAWSLPDGRIKTVVVAPEDDWLPGDPDLLTVNLRYQQEQGVQTLDILRELNDDLGDCTVYVDGIDPDEILIDMMFETFRIEPAFELAPFTDLAPDAPIEWLEDRRREIAFEHELAPELVESTVYAMLLLAQELDVLQHG